VSFPALLAVFAIPTLSVPFVYLVGKKSPKGAAIFVALIALLSLGLILSTVPTVLNSADHIYIEQHLQSFPLITWQAKRT
jgi:hypothetical protein